MNDDRCYAIVAIDAFLNLSSYGTADQDRVCGEWAAQVNSLALGQDLQVIIESNPVQPAAVISTIADAITTPHRALREVAGLTLRWLQRELSRTHVPALSGYLLIGPAPEPHMGLAGLAEGVKRAVNPRMREGTVDRRGLDAAVSDLLAQCVAMDLPARRLRASEVAALLWRTINPGVEQTAGLEAAPDLALALAPLAWTEEFSCVRAGPLYARTLYLLTPREVTNPGWLGELVTLPCTVRLSWHLHGLDRDRERTRLLRKRKAFAGVIGGQMAQGRLADLDAAGGVDEAAQQATDLLDAEVGLVQSTLCLTLQASTRAALDVATARAVSTVRTRLGARVGRGRGYQGPLWRASLPLGQNAVSSRALRWRTETAGNGYPFLAHSPGMAAGIPLGFTTRGHELVLLDLVDASLPNTVLVVAGRPGTGKTFSMQKLALWTLCAGGSVCVIDPAGHYQPLITVAGGAYIAPAKDRTRRQTINLWDYGDGEDMDLKRDFVVAAHEIMLTNPGETLPQSARAVLDAAVRTLYERHVPQGTTPLERELVEAIGLQARAGEGLTEKQRDMLAEMHATLEQYAGEGRYAHLVDRLTTVDVTVPVLGFDLGDLPEHIHALMMFTIAGAMAQRARSTYDPTRGEARHMLIIDEGWSMTEREGAARWLKNLALRSRHMGLLLVFASQQLSVLTDNPRAKAIIDAASLKMIYRLHDVRSGAGPSTLEWFTDVLHISAAEARTLTTLRNGQCMLFRESKDGTYRRAVVDVLAPPIEYWLFSSEPWRDVPARNAAVAAAGGDTWAAVKRLAAQEDRHHAR